MLKVLYNGLSINKGNIMSINQTKMKPHIFFDINPDKYYTIILVDPDAPSKNNPIYKYWLHWLVTNIKNNKEVIIDYDGPSPPKNSGDHRYIFILFEHDKKINIKLSKRNNFDINSFAKIYNLKLVDTNYFIVKSIIE